MEEKEYIIDLVEVAEIVKENCKPIVRITCGCIIIALLYLLIATPVYESEAVLQVKQKSGGTGMMMSALAGMGGADFLGLGGQQMGNYEVILKSRGVVVPVIEATEEKSGFFTKKLPSYEGYVKNRITIQNEKLTDILIVKLNAVTPEKAQKANQLLVDNFLKRIGELNSAEKGSLRGFLENRLKTARDDLDRAETALQDYKIKNKIISPSETSKFISERILSVEKQAAANQIEQETAEARLAAINSQLNGSGAATADNKTIQKYNSELAELETTLITYKERYTDKHPKMIELKERIANLKSKIQMEVNKIAALQAPSDNEVHQGLVAGKYSSEAAVKVLRQKGEALQKVIEQNNAELEKLPELERGYVKLSRDFQVANEINLLLTRKLEEIKITEHQNPDNVLVIDAPTLPDRPSKPKKRVILIVAALLGLLLSSGYIVFKELLHKVIRSEEDIKHYLELPILGYIPDSVAVAEALTATQETKEPGWKDKLKEYIWKK